MPGIEIDMIMAVTEAENTFISTLPYIALKGA